MCTARRSISRENRRRHDAITAHQSLDAGRDPGIVDVDCLGHSRDEGDAGATATARKTSRGNRFLASTTGYPHDEALPGQGKSDGYATASTGGDAE